MTDQPNATVTAALDAVASGQDLSAAQAAAVLTEIMARRGLPDPDRRLPDRACAPRARPSRSWPAWRRRCARWRRRVNARAAGPARHGRHRRRAQQLQRLDHRRADRGRRRLRGRQARQPLGHRPVGLRGPAGGARRAHRPRRRRRRALHRRGRLRLHVRARPPSRDAHRRRCAPRARGSHDLQLPRPADQPGRRAAPADRRLRRALPRDDRRRARAARRRSRARRRRRGRARRGLGERADAYRRGQRRGDRGLHRDPGELGVERRPRGSAGRHTAGQRGARTCRARRRARRRSAISPWSTPAPRSTPPAASASLREGVERAREAIDDGRAAQALERFVAATLDDLGASAGGGTA